MMEKPATEILSHTYGAGVWVSIAFSLQKETERVFIVCFIISNGCIVSYCAMEPNLSNQITVCWSTIYFKLFW